MVLPLEDGTTSPLMNRPSGCSYVFPLGVVIFLKRDMITGKFVCVSDGLSCSTTERYSELFSSATRLKWLSAAGRSYRATEDIHKLIAVPRSPGHAHSVLARRSTLDARVHIHTRPLL